MKLAITNNTKLTLAFDILADMILSFIGKKEYRSVPSEIREVVLAIMDSENEEQLNDELTAELLETTDYRLIA
jgi:hypothetical protein